MTRMHTRISQAYYRSVLVVGRALGLSAHHPQSEAPDSCWACHLGVPLYSIELTYPTPYWEELDAPPVGIEAEHAHFGTEACALEYAESLSRDDRRGSIPLDISLDRLYPEPYDRELYHGPDRHWVRVWSAQLEQLEDGTGYVVKEEHL